MHRLAKIALAAGLKELVAEVLPDNAPMLKVFENSGLRLATRRESGVVHVSLALVMSRSRPEVIGYHQEY
jgi:hypothetical protein